MGEHTDQGDCKGEIDGEEGGHWPAGEVGGRQRRRMARRGGGRPAGEEGGQVGRGEASRGGGWPGGEGNSQQGRGSIHRKGVYQSLVESGLARNLHNFYSPQENMPGKL